MKYFNYRVMTMLGVIFIITSCHKERRGPWKLHSGNGIWQVESIESIQYDSLGNELSSSTLINPGEFVFLKSNWGTAHTFMGKYVHYDTGGSPISTHPLNYNSDGKKLTIEGAFPAPIAGFYSIEQNGLKNHRWISLSYFQDQTYANRIQERTTVTLKKGKSKN